MTLIITNKILIFIEIQSEIPKYQISISSTDSTIGSTTCAFSTTSSTITDTIFSTTSSNKYSTTDGTTSS